MPFINDLRHKTTLSKGFTLLELLITLSISSILVASSIPASTNLSNHFAIAADKAKIQKIVNFARASAISYGSYMSVCSLEDKKCRGLSNDITVFADLNNDNKLNDGEQILTTEHLNASFMHWNRYKKMRFKHTGTASGYNGTLKYCRNKQGFQLIISNTGRTRLVDTDDHCKSL